MDDHKNVLKKYKCRVSSCLNAETNKHCMFDDKEETCWNSANGSPQWIEILLDQEENVAGFKFQFQGGFAGHDMRVEFFSEKPSCKSDMPVSVFDSFQPEDGNKLQQMLLENPIRTKFIRILFSDSTDFYGRIILYKFSILKCSKRNKVV